MQQKLEVERLAGVYSAYATGIRPDADAVLRERYANRLTAVQKVDILVIKTGNNRHRQPAFIIPRRRRCLYSLWPRHVVHQQQRRNEEQ